MTEEEDQFICPECKSTEYEEGVFMSKEPAGKDDKDPWASVLQQVECTNCKMIIPSHLGMRYGNKSYNEAVSEWKNLYKKDSLKQKF